MLVSVSQPVPLHKTMQGSGRPVILIHGWPLSSAAWQHQLGPLDDAGFRVITYDRRGFGQSQTPDSGIGTGYDYDTLASDLARLIEDDDLRDVTLVGFSMGGGEVARYVALYGEGRLRSVVFAASVTPYLLQTPDNPDGPLTRTKAAENDAGLTADRSAFFDAFATGFYSAHGSLMVSEAERQAAVALCHMSDPTAALACMRAFGTTDFRADLARMTVPALVMHGDADGIVDFAGSGQRAHSANRHSELVVIKGAPHGMNVSHAAQFNAALIAFLNKS